MPRISPQAFRRALSIDPHLARLLPVCRDLRSAQNELRWLRRHVVDANARRQRNIRPIELRDGPGLSHLVARRAKGTPLQYILGTEYFGELEIKCRPEILIPRQETAASVKHLVNIVTAQLSQYSPIANLRVLDLCTGTGCIPLLFHHEFYKRLQNSNTCLQLRGVDISPKALALAHENLDHVLAEHRKHASKLEEQRTLEDESLRTMTFSRANILAGQLPTTLVQASVKQAPMPDGSLGVDTESPRSSVEVFISNPPYVSPSSYKRTTARSVRDFEPKLALVPPAPTFGANKGDSFYPHLLDIAKKLSAKFVLLEVADLDQARRVAATAIQSLPAGFTLEIWRDEPSIARFEEDMIEGEPVRVVGEGNGRSVFIQYDDGRALSVDQAVQAKA